MRLPDFSIDIERNDDVASFRRGFVVSTDILPSHGSFKGGRIASFPEVSKDKHEPDKDLFIVSEALQAIASELVANIPEHKLTQWRKANRADAHEVPKFGEVRRSGMDL